MEQTTQPLNAPQNPQPAVTIGDWVITLLVASIPLVGFVMLFVWSFGGNANPNKANWAKAMLIWIAVVTVVYIFIMLLFGATFIALMNDSGYEI